MSQLPPPNFGNFAPAFNMTRFPGWPMVGATAPSIFGRPQIPSLGFPPRLPMNSFNGYPGSQLGPGIWPNVNPLGLQLNHVVAQERIEVHTSSTQQQQQKLQVTNFQVCCNAR